MNKVIQKYNVTQCALYKCKSQRRLEQLLGLKKNDLKEINNIIAYHSFQIDKKTGTEKRNITAPGLDLKILQSRILRLIQRIERPKWLISGEKGKCYVDNGKAHMFSNYVLTMDIKKFYENCKREYVFRFFKDYLKTSGDVAGILTDIVTFNGGIPTGCPTSQLIAYYAYQNMFFEINDIAQKFDCVFTLYVDDMTFSSELPIKEKALVQKIDTALRKYGHKPKYRKVRYYSKKSSKPITGTVVNREHKLEIPNSLQKKIYDNFQKTKNINFNRDILKDEMDLISSLRGQIQAAKHIEYCKFPEINRFVKAIYFSRNHKK